MRINGKKGIKTQTVERDEKRLNTYSPFESSNSHHDDDDYYQSSSHLTIIYYY